MHGRGADWGRWGHAAAWREQTQATPRFGAFLQQTTEQPPASPHGDLGEQTDLSNALHKLYAEIEEAVSEARPVHPARPGGSSRGPWRIARSDGPRRTPSRHAREACAMRPESSLEIKRGEL